MADIFWRDFTGTISKDVVPTQLDVYIAQVSLEDGWNVPGSLYPNDRIAVSAGPTGMVIFKTNIKYLCSSNPSNFEWVYVNTNSLDANFLEKCVPGGFEINQKLYIGKIFHEGIWKIGKVYPKSETTYTGLRVWLKDGRQYNTDDFQILMFINL